MQTFSASPVEMVLGLMRHRALIRTLIWREVMGRYRGSVFGLLWSFVHPVLMLGVYTFVFSVVFKARWTQATGSRAEFAMVLFAGLLVFNLFAECVNRAPGLILENANYVKRVVFPLEILPWVSVGVAVFHCLVGTLVWLVFHLALIGSPHPTLLLFPLALLPMILLTTGCALFLSALGVYLRDVGQFIGVLTTTLMFLSPIFYPVSALPQEFQPLFMLNPLTVSVEQLREVMYFGAVPDAARYLAHLGISCLVLAGGFAWFQRTRKGFADVL
ncbi:ABC transporter permease [Niveibacterium umoris]|uniref:Transport permease protein n=1 Tax=Niveibacterium umoris TaxID=1193620 RepID=A0A840BKZ2_9RHOO|nr:ABC transporter permease [Niveibacterium umoris]MBB4012238.1 lipopolysaccharide transport system permease protein [Niveibacterium umoris]